MADARRGSDGDAATSCEPKRGPVARADGAGASPPVPPPPAVAVLRRVSVRPRDVTSCLQWWTVDLFVTADGRIAAVTLDLYEP